MALVIGKTYRIKSHAGEGRFLRLATGMQTVSEGKVLQTSIDDPDNTSQHWNVISNSGTKIVSAINNAYALNFDTTDSERKAEIYPYSNSDANASIDLVIVDSGKKIYKIRITIDGTMYYLTSGSATSTTYTTWELASGGDNQK